MPTTPRLNLGVPILKHGNMGLGPRCCCEPIISCGTGKVRVPNYVDITIGSITLATPGLGQGAWSQTYCLKTIIDIYSDVVFSFPARNILGGSGDVASYAVNALDDFVLSCGTLGFNFEDATLVATLNCTSGIPTWSTKANQFSQAFNVRSSFDHGGALGMSPAVPIVNGVYDPRGHYLLNYSNSWADNQGGTKSNFVFAATLLLHAY